MSTIVAHGDVIHATGNDSRRELTGVCVAALDTELTLLHANDDFLAGLGRLAGEVYGLHINELLDPGVRLSVVPQLRRVAGDKTRRFTSHFRAVRLASHQFSGRMTALAVLGDDGAVSTIVLLIRPDLKVEHLRPAPARRRLLSEVDALVLEGVAAGSSTVQLAAKLYLSRQGVEYHVGSMLRRFRCSNRSALVAKAYTRGILTTGQWPPKVSAEHIH